MKSRITILIIASIFFLVSCNKPLFRPEQVHDPMLTEKGEFSSNFSILAFAPYGAPSFDLGVGYSPVKNLGIKAAFRSRTNLTGTETSNNGTTTSTLRKTVNGYSFEGGIGFYSTVDDRAAFSVYGTAIVGSNKYKDYYVETNAIDEFLNYNYLALCLQPSIVLTNKRTKMAFGCRVGGYQYNNIVNLNANSGSSASYENQEGKWNFVGEPYFNLEGGGQNIRFTTQVGYAFAPSTIVDMDLNMNVKFSVGVNFRLNMRKK